MSSIEVLSKSFSEIYFCYAETSNKKTELFFD